VNYIVARVPTFNAREITFFCPTFVLSPGNIAVISQQYCCNVTTMVCAVWAFSRERKSGTEMLVNRRASSRENLHPSVRSIERVISASRVKIRFFLRALRTG